MMLGILVPAISRQHLKFKEEARAVEKLQSVKEQEYDLQKPYLSAFSRVLLYQLTVKTSAKFRR